MFLLPQIKSQRAMLLRECKVTGSGLRIIVSGLIAQYPLGGIAWHYLQFVLGLKRLGHDVYYLEDTGHYPYNPREQATSKRCDFSVEHLDRVFSQYGLNNKWAYRFPWQSQWFGLSEDRRKEVIATTDVLINVSGTLEKPSQYRNIPKLVYIDTDPVFTQLKLARGQVDFRSIIDMHDATFTFGEQFSDKVPETGHDWVPTRQPIVLSEWSPQEPARNVFTTVMNWTSYNDVIYNGVSYGQKDMEFRRFLDLPERIQPSVLEIAVNVGKTSRTPRNLLRHKGWRLADPDQVCSDPDGYRSYIQSSKAEWTVAKNGYVQGQAGWFSERSACYLASGRPVVAQDTGFSNVFPVGQGLLAYSTLDQAVDAIRQVESEYEKHKEAARGIAEKYFDSDKVLGRLIDKICSVEPSRVESPSN